jgi:hypothetical protein
MPRFHFELVENAVIAERHYGLELHEIAVDELDSAVELARLLAERAAEHTMGPVIVTISDEAKNPFARIRISPNGEAPMAGAEGPANTQDLRFEEPAPLCQTASKTDPGSASNFDPS